MLSPLTRCEWKICLSVWTFLKIFPNYKLQQGKHLAAIEAVNTINRYEVEHNARVAIWNITTTCWSNTHDPDQCKICVQHNTLAGYKHHNRSRDQLSQSEDRETHPADVTRTLFWSLYCGAEWGAGRWTCPVLPMILTRTTTQPT